MGFLVALIVGCANGRPMERAAVLKSPGGLLFNGYVKTASNCYACHNGNGSGTGRGPDLAPLVPAMTDAEILRQIHEGGPWMPAFRDKLTDADEVDILEWLRLRFGGGAEATPSTLSAPVR
jgi:mono/diheme cytochrome c family protein